MAMWGKFFGGVAGFAMAGPAGALIGTALGHAADRGALLDPPQGGGWSDNWRARANPDLGGAATFVAAKIAAAAGKKDQLLAICSVALSAKLAKCDGPVNRREIDAFRRKFRIAPEGAAEVGRLFDMSRQRTDDFEYFARELAPAFAADKGPLEDLLSSLFFVARADAGSDGAITPEERRFLRRVHQALGLGPGAWDRAEAGRARPSMAEGDAYTVLGVVISDSDETIRMAWRALVRTYHPDLMQARGASPEELAAAAEKVSRINAAWDVIRRDRRL
ncbi:TerB family tellurite resistance protein [Acetobacter sp. AN02]|uniref:TerB family tellurite resistance protein n=1 Tax=Acetobacter sp. AN02 TaxID=2894186 RepID=UPI0024346110|nr:TerB family tellurite resistance protein [Acetobacter sp. AN02]MDG6094020.1 TerB family tellurite resistance protein [Acetobacter sp. AN02]